MPVTTALTSQRSFLGEQGARKWFAVVTTPRHEKAALRHLDKGGMESFLPTYVSCRVWKNRQKIKLELPLFPNYLFVRMEPGERSRVLCTPGVRQLIGNSREPSGVADQEIDFLRARFFEQKLEPYPGLLQVLRVRVNTGALRSVEGWLVRKCSDWRFVLTVQLIQQQVSVEVDASTLEPLN